MAIIYNFDHSDEDQISYYTTNDFETLTFWFTSSYEIFKLNDSRNMVKIINTDPLYSVKGSYAYSRKFAHTFGPNVELKITTSSPFAMSVYTSCKTQIDLSVDLNNMVITSALDLPDPSELLKNYVRPELITDFSNYKGKYPMPTIETEPDYTDTSDLQSKLAVIRARIGSLRNQYITVNKTVVKYLTSSEDSNSVLKLSHVHLIEPRKQIMHDLVSLYDLPGLTSHHVALIHTVLKLFHIQLTQRYENKIEYSPNGLF